MEQSAGCVAFKLIENRPWYGLILDRFGRWCFPKGHLEADESAFAAARRELKEEVGLAEVPGRAGELVTRLGETHYSFAKTGAQIEKQVEWFLVKAAPDAELQCSDPEHVAAVGWFSYYEAKAKLGYKDLKPLLKLADEIVSSCYAKGKSKARL